jgi:hypothetical protein
MVKRPWSVFVLFAVFVLVVGAACSASGGDTSPTAEPTEDSAAIPTVKPQPTAESPKPALPTQGAAPVGPAPFELDSAVYEHPSGTFSFNPPAGWTPSEGTGGVVFTSPDGVGTIDFSATNTGNELDLASFESFVQATEANYYGWRPEYTQVGYELDEGNGSALVAKTFTSDGIPQAVFTLYLLNGQGVYVFDFWSEEGVAQAYSDPYTELMSTINVDSTNVAEMPVYNYIYTYTDPNGLFQYEIPLAWTYSYDESENVYVDTFTSPDQHGVIQNITYDDGTTFTKSQAGAAALSLLNQSYTNGANDIRITDDKVQSDGSERLTWESRSGGFSGQSFFETRGTTFLMLSYLVDDGYADYYGPVWDNTLSTYSVP